jgi:hypothetical protein
MNEITALRPLNPLIQLIRKILIWGTLEILFLRFILNAPWILITMFVALFILVQVIRFLLAKHRTKAGDFPINKHY